MTFAMALMVASGVNPVDTANTVDVNTVDAAITTVASGVTAQERGSPDWVGPGFLGLAVILAIAVGTYLLWRSMNKQIKRVDFDEAGADGPEGDSVEKPSEPGGEDRR